MRPKNAKALARGDLNVAVEEYRQQSAYIAERVLRPISVAQQAAQFPVVPKEVMLANVNTNRGMRGFYNRSDWEFENGFYATSEKGWEEVLDDRELKLYRDMIDAEMIVVRRATSIMLRTQELRVANKLFNTSNFTPHALSIEWSKHATATPLDDINTAVEAVRQASGLTPNALILPRAAFKNLRRCAQIVDLLKYTFPGKDINSMSESQLAEVLDIDQVIVGDAQVNTAAKGKNAVLGEIWSSEYAMLTSIATSEDFSEACIGRIFRWEEESSMDEGGILVEQYRSDPNRGDVYRVRNDADERLLKSYDDDGNVQSDIAAAVSYLFSNVTE